MVKLGKKKLAEQSDQNKKKSGYADSDENPKNGAGNSSDDENVNKESGDRNETGSKKLQRPSQDDNETDESDDLPLNGRKASGASSGSSFSVPPRKKQKKTPKAKGKVPTSVKNDNKKATSKSDEFVEDDDEDENREKEFEVEAIVGQKTKRGESFFLVRWKGYGEDADSWEPEAELNCDDLISEYLKKASSKKIGISKKSPTSANKGVRGRKTGKKLEMDPDKEWAVERIIDFVDDDEHGGLYRIRWKGFGAKEDTWEPESNLSCEGLIEKFKKGLDEQHNVDVKNLRESPKKTKRLVNETIPRSNLHNRIERSSKRAAAKNRVFYGEE